MLFAGVFFLTLIKGLSLARTAIIKLLTMILGQVSAESFSGAFLGIIALNREVSNYSWNRLILLANILQVPLENLFFKHQLLNAMPEEMPPWACTM